MISISIAVTCSLLLHCCFATANGPACIGDAGIATGQALPCETALLQRETKRMSKAFATGDGFKKEHQRHHSAGAVAKREGPSHASLHSMYVGGRRGNLTKSFLVTRSYDSVSWHIYLTALALWLTVLTFLVGFGPLVSGVANIISHVWQSFQPDVPSKAASLTTTRDETEAGKMASPCITHVSMPYRSRLIDVLFPESAGLGMHSAIASATDSGRRWSYAQLKELMCSPSWAVLAESGCVGVALLPGPESAAALLCLLARTKCAPINADMPKAEAAAALQRVAAAAVLVTSGAVQRVQAAAKEISLPIWSVPGPWEAGDFVPTLCTLADSMDLEHPETTPEIDGAIKQQSQLWNTADDVCLLLRTSGTTGKSKVVPLRLGQLLMGAQSIAASMGLGREDVCLNAMPLFHIGGISCNLLGSLVSGGSVICVERFDPRSFVECLGASKASTPPPTWYYAVPSMHLAVVNFCGRAAPEHCLRLVRSGAAVLPPGLQERTKELFGCPVFATYSMTECMPIASPVIGEIGDAHLYGGWPAPLGSVGRPVGPTVVIRDGEVLIGGELVMKGYEGPNSGLTEDGLLPTGDLGYLDTEGFLWLVGRKKEMINRGGETIPPQEVEEAVSKFDWVQEVAAFAVPHQGLGEAVGLAVVLEDSDRTNTGSQQLLTCAAALQEQLGRSHFPSLVAFVDALPRTPAGKVQRLSLFQALHDGGGPEGAISEGMRSMVLDARGAKGGVLQCRYLVPNPDSVASLFLERVETSVEADTEVVDSMGQRRMVSRRDRFEMSLVLQMYIIGILAITLIHYRWYAKSMIGQLSAPMQLLTGFLTENKWHLQMFFAGAGYLDRDQPLNARDLAAIMLVLVLPLMHWLPFVPSSTTFAKSWFGLNHPARWFFLCLSAARSFSVAGRAAGLSKITQVLLALPYACLWPNLCLSAYSLVTPGGHSDIALQWLGVGIPKAGIVNKLIASTVTYMVWLNMMPTVIEYLAKAGPKTKRSERRLGLFFWLLLSAWMFFDLHSGLYRLEEHTARVPLTGSFWPRAWVLAVPTGLPLAWAHIGLLVASLAYLPFTAVPESSLRSLLAALLLMPFLIHGETIHLLSLCLRYFQSSFAQLLVFFVFFWGFLVLLAPLLQAACLRGGQAALRFWPLSQKV